MRNLEARFETLTWVVAEYGLVSVRSKSNSRFIALDCLGGVSFRERNYRVQLEKKTQNSTQLGLKDELTELGHELRSLKLTGSLRWIALVV
jgi:hypothetical protein